MWLPKVLLPILSPKHPFSYTFIVHEHTLNANVAHLHTNSSNHIFTCGRISRYFKLNLTELLLK